MNRIFTFHFHDTVGNEKYMLPAYYIDKEYEKVAVRLHSLTAPVNDAKIDIYDDGVSIFNNRKNTIVDATTGAITYTNDYTYAVLPSGVNSDELAEDFNKNIIEAGSWLTCKLVNAGGGKDFTVQLELHQLSEDDERED